MSGLAKVNVKQSSAVDNSVDQLQDVGVHARENGIGEDLIGVRQSHSFERVWLLWLNRSVLGRWMIRGLIVVTIIAFLLPKHFESTTRLMPPDPHSGSSLGMLAAMAMPGTGGGAAGSELGGMASDLLGLKDPGALFAEMLRSRTVKDRLIARFDLRKVYGTRYWEGARKKLTKRTDVSVDRKSGVITVTVTDNDPNRASQIAQAYVEELDRIAAEVNTSAAHRERLFIEQRLKVVKQDLDKASKEFSEYSSQNATLDIKEQGVAMVEAAAVLQGQLIAAQSELEGLEQVYTGSNVRVRSLRARVDELQRQLKKVGGDPAHPGAGDPKSELGFPSIRGLPLVGVRWADLFRENKIEETVYELLTEQYELSKIDEAKETPVVKVLDLAVVPEKRSDSGPLLVILVGVILTFIAGSAWVIGKANWQEMDPEDPRKQLGQEIGVKLVAVWSKVAARWQLYRQKVGGKNLN